MISAVPYKESALSFTPNNALYQIFGVRVGQWSLRGLDDFADGGGITFQDKVPGKDQSLNAIGDKQKAPRQPCKICYGCFREPVETQVVESVRCDPREQDLQRKIDRRQRRPRCMHAMACQCQEHHLSTTSSGQCMWQLRSEGTSCHCPVEAM